MRLEPLEDRVIIEPIESDSVSAGGIYIPETAKETPQKGAIVAAGTGKWLEDGKRLPMKTKVGDIVLFSKYSGTELEIECRKYLITKETEILAIFKED